MKKCECGFETNNNEFEFCPMCSKPIEIYKGKRLYIMNLSAEQDYSTEIEMTYEEAEIVDRVLKELSKNSTGYCGSCWINF